ncbi:MAG TPA: hypothetical protein VMK65_12015, partial [Longimicrobiales bacterium]|nr:hypothetical protein [Longimicrobiales bacterium]
MMAATKGAPMRTPGHTRAAAAGLALAAAGLLALPAGAAGQVAVRGGVVHTVSGAPIQDGVVLVGADGRIER